MTRRPALRTLADRMQILPDYVDTSGITRTTSDSTREAILIAMGWDVSSEELAERARVALDEEAATQILPPVQVVRSTEANHHVGIPIRGLPTGPWEWILELAQENGIQHRTEGRVTVRGGRAVTLPVTAPLAHGYHQARLTLANGNDELKRQQLLVIAPPSCLTAGELLGHRRLYGLTTSLYTIRSERNWGVGDLGDLSALLQWAGDIGAAFVGVNPLHALRNHGEDISPYGPISRLYRNPIYLDIPSIPELAISDDARAHIASTECVESRHRVRAGRYVDYEAVMALKEPVLSILHAAFVERHRGGQTQRGQAYDAYRRAQGHTLDDFATFRALEDHLATRSSYHRDWRRWPAKYRDPQSPAVREFRERFADAVDYHRWIQFELDRQVADSRNQARAAGLPIGLYGDLAIGSSSSGSDTWAFPRLFVQGAHVGAPPDDYSATGQDWGLPPIHPIRLHEDRYRYWILLVQNAMLHFGALRIDHVMGLFRQFWIPAGRPGSEGAYVRFPSQYLLAVLALESRRRRALVIGEDLGTVPRGLPARLARWGILSTRVLYFERNRRGGFRPATRYSRRALVTATTHDHPPLAGFWAGRDLVLRRQTDSIGSDDALNEAQRRRAKDKRALIDRLRQDEIVVEEPRNPARLCAAIHRFLARAPSPLVGVSLDDITGEVDPVNLPGVGLDRYRSWSRRMRVSLEKLASDGDVHEALSGIVSRKHA